nr:Ig-like domain-containing protein [uncultured Pseudomonas sp.]
MTVDTTAPTTTAIITGVADNVGTNTGNVSDNSSTDDSSLVISGTISVALSTGETLVVYDGTTRLGTATITQGTSWSYTASSLTSGTHSFTARVEQDIGLRGADSTAFNTNVTGLSALSASDDVGTTTGSITSGNSTDDATPALSGTLTAQLLSGERVGIYEGTTRLGYATVNAARTGWEYTPATALSSGQHTLTAKVEKADGTALMSSAEFTLTVVPAQTVEITAVNDNAGGFQGNIVNNGVTDDITPLISGTLSAPLGTGDSVVVYDGITKLGTATVDSSNPGALTWSLATGPLSGGNHYLTARVENTSGQNGATSSQREFIVSGFTFDTFTDNTPTPNGSTFNTGDLPLNNPVRYVRLSGLTAALFGAGDIEVWAMVNGVRTNVALNKPTLTSTGGSVPLVNNGDWGFGRIGYVSNPDGNGWFEIDLGANYNISSINLVKSGYSNTQLDTLLSISSTSMASHTNANLLFGNNPNIYSNFRPGQKDATYNFTNPALVSDDDTPLLSGSITSQLSTGQHIYVYDGTIRLGEATIDTATQRWSFQVQTPLSDGNHTFTAKVENGSTTLLTADTFNVRIVPSQILTINGATEDSGRNTVIPDGGIGYDSTPTLTGSISAALKPGEVLVIYNGINRNVITSIDNTALTWSYTPPELTSSRNIFIGRVEREDSSFMSNSSQTTFTYNYLTSPINISDNTGTVTGKIDKGGSTDDTSPLLSGTLSHSLANGELLAIYDKTQGRIGYATIDAATLTWTYTPTFSFGSYSLSAVIENSAGIVISSPTAYPINVVDPNYVPTQTVGITTVTNRGIVVPDGHSIGVPYNNTSAVLNGTLSAPLQSGDVIRFYASGRLLNGYATVDSTGLAWSYAYYSPGLKNVTTEIYNQATGKVSASSAPKVVNEIITSYTNAFYEDDVGSITGETRFNNTTTTSRLNTDDAQPGIKYSFNSAVLNVEQVSVYLDGVNVGIATLNAARTVATYAFATPLVLGKHSIELKLENQDGTSSNISDIAYVDVTARSTGALLTTAVIAGYTDNLGVKQGAVTTSVSTDDNTPTFTGAISDALKPGESVVIYRNGTKLGTATVNPTALAWSYAPSLATGESSITARVENSSTGDVGEFSSKFTYNHSVTSITSLTDDTGFHTGSFISGSSSDDTSPELSGTLTSPLLAGEYVALYIATTKLAGYATIDPITNNWTYLASGLTTGSHSITAKILAADDTILSSSSAYTVNIVANEQLNIVVQTSLNGSSIGNNSALPGVQVANDRSMDWTLLSSHGKVDRVDLGNSNSKLTLSLSDILQSDSNIFDDSIFAGLTTANGQHQMVITSATPDSGMLTLTSGNWVKGNDVTAGGQTYHVYNTGDNSAQLIVDTDIRNSMTSVI